MKSLGDARHAATLQRFFKTGPGEYGAGDRFLGIRLPALHRLAREYQQLPRREVAALLRSPWHEERLLALLILVRQYARADTRTRNAIFRLYLRQARHINNWDLVDCSAGQIVGAHLQNGDRGVLRELARSRLVWRRRIAVIAAGHYIKRGEFDDTLTIARMLLDDPHDLVHKAVGWMLREVGKRDRAIEEAFLRQHVRRMPRTMLRYAIEHFPEKVRQAYLAA
jgi:3-methyladenine DNA glycosylase AlkD